MKMSVREARAQFAAALNAVENGERVTITKNGAPVAELGPPASIAKKGFDWEKADRWRNARGYDRRLPDNRTDEEWFADFNDPAVTAMMIGDDKDADLLSR